MSKKEFIFWMSLLSAMALFIVIGAAINSCKLIQKQEVASQNSVTLNAGNGDRYAAIAYQNDVRFHVTVQTPANFYIHYQPGGAYVQFAESVVNVYYGNGVIQNIALGTEKDSTYYVWVKADSIFRNGAFVYKAPGSGFTEIRVGTYRAAAVFEFQWPEKDAWAFDFPDWQIDTLPEPSAIDTLIGNQIEASWTHPAPEPKMHFLYNWNGGSEDVTDTTSSYSTGWFEPGYEGAWTFRVSAVDSAGNESADAILPFYFFRPDTVAPPPDTTAPPAPFIEQLQDTIFNITTFGRPIQINVK